MNCVIEDKQEHTTLVLICQYVCSVICLKFFQSYEFDIECIKWGFFS